MSGDIAAELAVVQKEQEKFLMGRATWLVHSASGSDGAGGRVEGWLATADPGTHQPTVPIRVYPAPRPTVVGDIGGEFGRVQQTHFADVPLRLTVKDRDRFQMVGSTVEYEVLEVFGGETYATITKLGMRRIR